ncbi:MAG: sulfotransferase [Candidatus Omnitrophica bacterium]|nr:sulfotransferase [Candidatus Omnitrophota bacterium]
MRIFGLPFGKQNHLLPFDENPPLKGDNLDYQKFIILASPRTGSSYLVSLLGSHTQTICYGEIIISLKSFSSYYPGYDSERFTAFRDKYPIKFMEKLIFRKYPSNIAAVGFKIFYQQARQGRLKKVWPYLKNLPDLKIIHLKRKNLLKSYLSYRLTKITNVWQIHDASQVTKDIKIQLGYNDCLDYFLRMQKWIDQCNILFKDSRVLEVFYEDLDKDCSKETNRIQKFLNLETETLRSSLKKLNIHPLTETISNYWELKEKFKNTYWVNFFEE